MEVISTYVDVILPLPLAGTFTYSVADAMREHISVGSRVIVPFGRRKFYTGIVTGFQPIAPKGYEVKEVLYVLDAHPIVRYPQLKFWEWMADYYLCSIGEVYKAAVPSGLKIESETLFESNPDFTDDELGLLNEREVIVMQILQVKGKLSAKDLEKETGFRSIPAIMQRMAEKGAVIIAESLVDKYRSKKEKFVRLSFSRNDGDALKQAFDSVKGAKKQETLLLTLLQLSGFTVPGRNLAEVRVADALEKSGVSSQILKALVEKGIVERYTRDVSRFKPNSGVIQNLPTLSEAQQIALNSIHKQLAQRPICLLYGVTSSGKTEIYAHLIDYVLSQGQQVLYLVPEIALTTQLTNRLRNYFGDKLLVYHSKFSDNERVEIWNKLLRSNSPYVIVGARSAVFLPFAKLGLVVIDEEHDASYKQFDPAPRYNARDAALMLAHMHGAKSLLGSATPGIDTYYKSLIGKYGLVELTQRYNGASLPSIEIIDLGKEWKKQNVKGSFAMPLISEVRNAVKDGNQAIIFHNRRGFAPLARCSKCQYVPKCQYCDVSLTYHKRANSLICHYCGTVYPLPETCPACKEPTLEVVGYGTERIEDEVENTFPEAKVMRMDLDTTRNKNSYEAMIDSFSSKKADILVGTQMVTKGLDFGGVSVVGIVNADNLINYPDFRSAERAFDMIQQVAGRAGRRDKMGKVIIQTRNPEHPVIKFASVQDYGGFYEYEIKERQAFVYPPFSRLIYLNFKHRDEHELDNLTQIYAQRLRQLFGSRVNGPAKPPVGRVQSMFIRQILLKVELNASMSKLKEILRNLHAEMHAQLPAMRNTIIYYDVDPY